MTYRKYKHSRYFILFLILFSSQLSWSQEIPDEDLADLMPLDTRDTTIVNPFESQIMVSAWNDGNKVRLRWAPDKPAGWYYALKSGYHIRRTPVVDGLYDSTQTIQLTANPIFPWSIEQLEEEYKRNGLDTLSMIAGQMVHGKTDLKNLSPLERSDLLSMRYSYTVLSADLSAQAADIAGLAFTDTIPMVDSFYVYEIYADVDTAEFALFPGMQVVNPFVKDSIPRPSIYEVVPSDKAVRLEWRRAEHEPFFSAYYIERADAESQTWKRLNNFPYLPVLEQQGIWSNVEEIISYVDSVPENDKLYKYRMRGITPFGELSDASKEVIGMGQDLSQPAPPIQLQVREQKAGKLTISWILESDLYDENEVVEEQNVKGFLIARSAQEKGPYTFLTDSLIPAESREYVDSSPYPYIHNYYLVYIVNDKGKYGISLSANGAILDTTAPAQPKGLYGSIDSLGQVQLYWSPGYEADLAGYYIYYDYIEDGVFHRINGFPLVDTAFIHQVSMQTLSREVFYKVAAVDYLGNVSQKSETILLLKPDIHPPISPQITDISVKGQHIHLTWAPSASYDVKFHVLQRRIHPDTVWVTQDTIFSWDMYNTFIDIEVKSHRWYDYRLIAEDISSLQSEPSDAKSLRTSWLQSELEIPQLIGRYEDSEKSVHLQWESRDENILSFDLYRVNEKGILHTVRKIPASERSYVDKIWGNGKQFTYQIRANRKDSVSGFSPELVIELSPD